MVVRVLVIVLVGLVLIGAAVMYQMDQKREVGDQSRIDLVAELSVLPGWDEYGGYIDQLATQLHGASFDASYVRREGVAGGVVSLELYERIMLGAMIRRAESDKRQKVAEALLAYCSEYGIEAIDPGR